MLDRFFYTLFKEHLALSHNYSSYLGLASHLMVLGIVGYAIFKLLRYLGRSFFKGFASKTKTNFDDILIENRVFLHLSRILILVIVYGLLNSIFSDFPGLITYVERLVSVLIVFAVIGFLRSLLLGIKDYLHPLTAFKDKPLDSYVQIFMVVLWIIGIAVSFSIITGRPLLKFFTALGAFSAVLLLIFKDSILGLVASIQISINDTVRLNDWITMEKYKADGNVIEINLASVIVKNFDNTITSIPTYSLISESFKNWRSMSNSPGRRIKRAILIKINSIDFLSNEDLNHYKRIELITDYVQAASDTIASYNLKHHIDKSLLINGRNLTNFGLFREYVDAYLKQHPKINQDLLFMTRQLEPTPNGIPLEIYAFSSFKLWSDYERVMADIFDHVLASVPYFKLEVFENPSGKDIKAALASKE